MRYLVVNNWRKTQTYRKDRGTPPWIKVKRSLLSSAKWARLSDAQKGQLVSIWLIAAERDGRVPDDATILRKVCALDDDPDVELFVDLGFLRADDCQSDDNVTTSCQSTDCQVTSAETETESESEAETEKEGRASKRSIPKHAKDFFEACRTADCLDEAFDWLDVLKRKKCAMTEYAWNRRLAKLQRLSENEPPAVILSRSADRGWSDLYERNQRRRPHVTHETAVQRRQRQAREALAAAE